jgi:hypothetical protein
MKNDKNNEIESDLSIRELSMKWWNGLSALRKTQICDTNTKLVGSVRRWETLTGSEIEKIYKKYSF